MSDPTSPDAMPEGTEAPPPGTRFMAVFRWLLVLVMAGAAVSALIYYRGTLDSAESHSAETYYCPMHPQVVQDEPGECPICHMTLVPKPPSASGAPQSSMGETAAPAAPAPSGLSSVVLSAERTQLIGLATAAVERKRLAPELRALGNVVAAEDRVALVQVRFAGWIQALHVANTGDRVKKGQLLAEIYSPDLVAAEQELVNAVTWASSAGPAPVEGHASAPPATGLLEDARQRLALLGVAPEDIAAIVRTKKPLRTLKVRSAVTGIVSRKNVVQGSYVQPGTALFEVADLSTVWLLADVYEQDLTRIAEGQGAQLTLVAYPGETFQGRVELVYPTVDATRRTVQLRLVFKNPTGRLKPGMYGHVVLATAPIEGLVVPAAAVVDTGAEQYLFVAKDGGRFEPRLVVLGTRTAELVEIRSGVAEGEQVVTTGNFLLDSESRLHTAVEGQAAMQPGASESTCDRDFDKEKFPEKAQQCRQCEAVHRGMGTMEDDCKKAIPRPWR